MKAAKKIGLVASIIDRIKRRPEVTANTPDFSVDKDTPEILKAGRDYGALANTPGYVRLLNDLEHRADEALGKVRTAEYADPQILVRLVERWREAEASLLFVQTRVNEAVQRRTEVLREVNRKLQGELDDDGDQTRRIQEFMGVEGGLIPIDEDEATNHNQSPFNEGIL